MSRKAAAALLALGCLLGSSAVTAHTPAQIRAIGDAYSRIYDGRTIPDAQLNYYLGRSDEGWTLDEIGEDMQKAEDTSGGGEWRPRSDWVARAVVCTSINGQYMECAVPFNGRAQVLEQMSRAPCTEGQTWGQKSGVVWVSRGCRGRFGITARAGDHQSGDHQHGDGYDHSGTPGNIRPPERRVVVCQSRKARYRECPTGTQARVSLVKKLQSSRACIERTSWGQRPGTVWVKRGCRAQFASVNRWTPGPVAPPAGSRPPNGQWMNNFYVTCGSVSGVQRCSWDERYGQPRIGQQLSQTACTEGQTWDYDTERGEIWVSGGCRARFVSSQTGWNPGAGGNQPWVRDEDYAVNCFSEDGRRSECTWDSRYGSPRIIQQLSQESCEEGSDWGYDSNGGLWVNYGCRARFGYR